MSRFDAAHPNRCLSSTSVPAKGPHTSVGAVAPAARAATPSWGTSSGWARCGPTSTSCTATARPSPSSSSCTRRAGPPLAEAPPPSAGTRQTVSLQFLFSPEVFRCHRIVMAPTFPRHDVFGWLSGQCRLLTSKSRWGGGSH